MGAYRTQNAVRGGENSVRPVSVRRPMFSSLRLRCVECPPACAEGGQAGMLIRVSSMHEIALLMSMLNLCFWAGRVPFESQMCLSMPVRHVGEPADANGVNTSECCAHWSGDRALMWSRRDAVRAKADVPHLQNVCDAAEDDRSASVHSQSDIPRSRERWQPEVSHLKATIGREGRGCGFSGPCRVSYGVQ